MRIPWLLVTLCMKSKVIFGSHFGHYRHSDHLTEALRTIRGLLSPIKKEDVKTNYFWTCKITTTLQILEQVFAFVFWIYPFNIQPLEVSCCLRSGAMFLTLHSLWLFLSMSYVCFCIFVFVFAHVLCLSLQPVAGQGGHLEAVAVLDQRTPCWGEDMPYLLVSILYFLVMFIYWRGHAPPPTCWWVFCTF